MIVKLVKEMVGANALEVFLDMLSEDGREKDNLRKIYDLNEMDRPGIFKLSGICEQVRLRIFLWRE